MWIVQLLIFANLSVEAMRLRHASHRPCADDKTAASAAAAAAAAAASASTNMRIQCAV